VEYLSEAELHAQQVHELL